MTASSQRFGGTRSGDAGGAHVKPASSTVPVLPFSVAPLRMHMLLSRLVVRVPPTREGLRHRHITHASACPISSPEAV
eukprot:2660306-Pleurochrysis_carterae.AAC.1